VEVEKIRQTYEPRLKQSKDPEEGKQIQNEAVSKMQETLTKEGLNEQSYGQIFEIARADEDLRQKLVAFINEEKQKS
jgi:GTP1/Obg family GTP-binding protein